MSLSERLVEYVRACFTGLWIESHEHEDALAEIAGLCRQENWPLAVWDIERGLNAVGEQARPVDADWTGAEITGCCRLAALLDLPLVDAAQHLVPIGKSNREAIDRLRQWADGRCLSADTPGVFHARRTGRGQTVGPEPSTN